MRFPATENLARVTEVFSSIQGEGRDVGERHIFVRFEECHMHCGYCDEIHKVGVEKTIDDVVSEVLKLERECGRHDAVSLTGGEPLLYLPFLKPLMKALKAEGFRLYLETSGVLWRALEEVLELCDVIAMDLKPASVTEENGYFVEHEKFLQIAKSKNIFLKMVVSKTIDFEEYDRLVEMVARVLPGALLFLQPISTNIEGYEDSDLMNVLNQLKDRSCDQEVNVRIGMRLHKLLNIR